MNTISFMSANFVARELGYHMTEGWGQGDRATNAYFRPIETFPERFEALLEEVSELGFTAIDIWTGHLHWAWATEEHIQVARALLDKYGFTVTSLAGSFGATLEEFQQACGVAQSLGTTILGGSTPLLSNDYDGLVRILRERGLVFGFENHPAEKTPADVLAKLGSASDVIGTAVDTGWYGTNGYDAAQAIEELRERIVHVHLKDVKAAGAHDTCQFGEGVVPIEASVRALKRMGYSGAISVEHEPEDRDPSQEVRVSAVKLAGWLER
jgi:sugar phosphate isomerase/epimerase